MFAFDAPPFDADAGIRTPCCDVVGGASTKKESKIQTNFFGCLTLIKIIRESTPFIRINNWWWRRTSAICWRLVLKNGNHAYIARVSLLMFHWNVLRASVMGVARRLTLMHESPLRLGRNRLVLTFILVSSRKLRFLKNI